MQGESYTPQQVFGGKELIASQNLRKRIVRQQRIEAIKEKFLGRIRRYLRERNEPIQIDLRKKESEPSYKLSREELELLRTEVENPARRNAVIDKVSKCVGEIKTKLPWVNTSQSAAQRLAELSDRIAVSPIEDIGQLAYAFEPDDNMFEVDQHGRSTLEYLGFHTTHGDFIVLPEDLDEERDGPMEQVILEEILHFMSALPEDKIKQLEQCRVFVTEGATRYYLIKVVGKENLAKRLTKGREMSNTLTGEKIWGKWVEKYGEDTMANVYFNSASFPAEIDLDNLRRRASNYLHEI